MSLIGLLVALLLVALVLWVVRTLVPALGIPEPIATVLWVIAVVIVVLWLIGILGGPTFVRLR
jgi:hypothetical protein